MDDNTCLICYDFIPGVPLLVLLPCHHQLCEHCVTDISNTVAFEHLICPFDKQPCNSLLIKINDVSREISIEKDFTRHLLEKRTSFFINSFNVYIKKLTFRSAIEYKREETCFLLFKNNNETLKDHLINYNLIDQMDYKDKTLRIVQRFLYKASKIRTDQLIFNEMIDIVEKIILNEDFSFENDSDGETIKILLRKVKNLNENYIKRKEIISIIKDLYIYFGYDLANLPKFFNTGFIKNFEHFIKEEINDLQVSNEFEIASMLSVVPECSDIYTKIYNSMSFDEKCLICQKPINIISCGALKNCTHKICLSCIESHLLTSMSCPICNNEILELSLIKEGIIVNIHSYIHTNIENIVKVKIQDFFKDMSRNLIIIKDNIDNLLYQEDDLTERILSTYINSNGTNLHSCHFTTSIKLSLYMTTLSDSRKKYIELEDILKKVEVVRLMDGIIMNVTNKYGSFLSKIKFNNYPRTELKKLKLQRSTIMKLYNSFQSECAWKDLDINYTYCKMLNLINN